MDSTRADTALEAIRLQHEVEQFYYTEANLLDDREFDRWLDLFADDLSYRMPLVRNVKSNAGTGEYLEAPLDVAWIDDSKSTLVQRVRQIQTGVHWAEEPLSRTTHLVTNVQIQPPVRVVSDGESIEVRSGFLSYRHRLADQEALVVGRRTDVLRRAGESWLIRSRVIYLNQTIYLGQSLSHFL